MAWPEGGAGSGSGDFAPLGGREARTMRALKAGLKSWALPLRGREWLGKSVTASYPPRLDHSALVRTKTEAMVKEGWVESRSPRLATNRSGC